MSHECDRAEIERSYQFDTLDALQQHFDAVYGPRNSEHLRSTTEAMQLFAVGIRDLRESRREDNPAMTEVALARLGSRVFTLAQAYGNIQVGESLEQKYPANGCAYCGQIPCGCGETRDHAVLDQSGKGQRKDWDLSHWQQFLDQVYGDRNRQRGFDNVTGRLTDELIEAIALEHFAGRMDDEQLHRHYSHGIADLAAWVLAVGNVVGVDVQKAVENRYGNGCPTCGNFQCSCSEEQFSHVYEILE